MSKQLKLFNTFVSKREWTRFKDGNLKLEQLTFYDSPGKKDDWLEEYWPVIKIEMKEVK